VSNYLSRCQISIHSDPLEHSKSIRGGLPNCFQSTEAGAATSHIR
jgi:hypothetical protein